MKISNAFQLEDWRNGVKKELESKGFADSKTAFEAYVRVYYKTLYASVRGQYEDIEHLSWKQISDIFINLETRTI